MRTKIKIVSKKTQRRIIETIVKEFEKSKFTVKKIESFLEINKKSKYKLIRGELTLPAFDDSDQCGLATVAAAEAMLAAAQYLIITEVLDEPRLENTLEAL